MSAYSKELEKRLADCVSARLGVPVTFAHWIREKTGADRPVFIVPESARHRARELNVPVAV